jgi:protein-tyrosine phosphatase
LDEGRLFPLHAGPYVLIHWDQPPVFTEELIFNLQLAGYLPIIAHPERSAAVERNPDVIAKLVSKGVLTQITALSITGGFGPRVKALAEQLLKRRMVHFIATDTHSVEPERRAPALARAVEAAARIVGQEEAEAMVMSRPASVLAGERVSVDAPLPASTGFSFWPFARSR